jgi:hypothetical protein
MKSAFPFLLVLLALALQGCGREVRNANLNEVKPEMSVKEVESILGPPSRTEFSSPAPSQEVVKNVPITHYYYEQNGRTVKLTFVNDRLASGGVEGSFDK